MMEKWKKSLQILLFFCKIGCFTFGGGWSIVAQMQQEFVEKRGWITEEELLDFTSVARSLPGIMIANTSLIFGYHMAGVPGALAAVVGITIPSVVIIALVTLVYDAFRSNPFVLRALTGVRAAVIPIILSAALRLRKGALKDWIGYALAAVAAALSILGVNNIIIILFGVAAGLLISEAKERAMRKEGGGQ
jgi:chromate transporter